jgi:hypothetical protein
MPAPHRGIALVDLRLAADFPRRGDVDVVLTLH